MTDQAWLKGAFIAITTPFTEEGEVDLEALERNLEMWSQSPVDGYLVLGSTGEWPHLGEHDRQQVIKTVVANKDGRRVLAGTGAISTWETLYLTEQAAGLGVDGCLVLPPFYFRKHMNNERLHEHFTTVADHAEVPVVLYNMPACTGIHMDAELVCGLSDHSNITGIKDSSADITRTSQYVQGSFGEFQVMTGSASVLLPALSAGAAGGIMALANILPWECKTLVDHFRAGEMEEALQLQQRLLPVNQTVVGKYGIPGVKAAMDMLGYHGGPPLRPLTPVTEADKQAIRTTLKDAGFLGC